MKKKVIDATVAGNRKIAPDHFIMDLESPGIAGAARPGQFINLRVADRRTTDPLLSIPLGIHRIHRKGISLLYKVVGEGTDLLSGKRKKDNVRILGPLGNGFDIEPVLKDKERVAILVGGGHGAAPLYALAEQLIRKKVKVEVFLGSSTKDHVVCAKEFDHLGAKVYISTEDGTLGYKGYITCLLQKHLERNTKYEILNTSIYACGPKPMLAALADTCRRHSIEAQVSVDEYMGCGIGVCLGCAIMTKKGYKYICKDGPVFDAQEIEWTKANVC